MAETITVHECLFCPQKFPDAASKDDHVLQHFAQEMCSDCDQNMIRIGGKSYVLHNSVTCIGRTVKSEQLSKIDSGEPIDAWNAAENDSNNQNVFEKSVEEQFPWLTEAHSKTDPLFDNNDFEESSVLEQHSDVQPNIQEQLNDLMIKVENIQTESLSSECNTSPLIAKKTDQSTKNAVECDICGKILSHQKNLKTHKVLKHSSPDTIYCNQCGRVFMNIEIRDVHWKECVLKARIRKKRVDPHTSNELFCRLCRTEFKSIDILKDHMQKHLAEIDMFKCQFCYAVFANQSSLNIHNCQCNQKLKKETEFDPNNDAYTENIETSTTEQADRMFSDDLKQEMEDIEQGTDCVISTQKDESVANGVECDICGKKISCHKNLKTHKVLKHSSPDTIYCNQCGRLFPNIEDRDVHWRECVLKGRLRLSRVPKTQRRTNTELRQKKSDKLWCGLCKMEFESTDILRNHMQQHLAEIKMFKCQFCYAIFSKEFSLLQHKCRTNQMEQFFCKNCRNSFSNPNERDSHQAKCYYFRVKRINQHLESGNLRVRKFGIHDEFECYLCKSKIKRLGDLRRHMRAKHHPCADKFKCKVCKATFMSESTTQYHQCKKPTKDKPYVRKPTPCDICGKILNKGSLYTHRIKSHSPIGTIICRYCPKIFKNEETRKAHEPQCIKRIRVQHTCEKCGKVLSSRCSYLKHYVSFHSEPGTIFCKICVRKFKSKEELKIHREECSVKNRLRRSKRKTNEPSSVQVQFKSKEDWKIHWNECSVKDKIRRSKYKSKEPSSVDENMN